MGNASSFALAFLLLASTGFAFDFESFIPQNSSCSLSNFTHDNSSAQAVVCQGKVHAILLPSFPFGTLEPETEKSRIENALESYYVSQGYSPKDINQLSWVHYAIGTIKGNYKKGEARCRVLTGTDRFPCTDFLSCQKACYSVTSFCQPIALGAGRAFINTIWKFENDSAWVASAYALENRSYANLSMNATRENIISYLSAIENLNRATTSAASSQLYDAYSYCFQPDYARVAVTGLQLAAQNAWKNSSVFFELSPIAADVQKLTYAGIDRQNAAAAKKLSEQLLNASNSSGNNSSLGAANVSAQSPTATDVQPPDYAAYSLLAVLLLAMFLGVSSAFFHLKRRSRR